MTEENPQQLSIPGLGEFITWFEETYKDQPPTTGADFVAPCMRPGQNVRILIHYFPKENHDDSPAQQSQN